MDEQAVEATIGSDGAIRLSDAQLAALGARPGDVVRVLPGRSRRPRSFLGAGARPVDFISDHLREVRSEMGEGIGDDLRR